MKITYHNWLENGESRPAWRGGFTLVEMLTAMTVFVMSIGALMSVHIFGAKLYELSKAKLGVSDEARIGLAGFIDEVRTNGLIFTGYGSISSFASNADGTPHVGNAIRIHATNSLPDITNDYFVQYVVDSNTHNLYRIGKGDVTPKIIVHSVTNMNVFSQEDWRGNVLTNVLNNRVIGLFLQITQLNPQISVTTGGVFDYYQLRSKATKRNF